MTTADNKNSIWSRGISIGELITLLAIVFGSMLMFWKTTDIRLSALELQMQQEHANSTIISTKLDHLQEGINDVKVTIQNKQDRK